MSILILLLFLILLLIHSISVILAQASIFMLYSLLLPLLPSFFSPSPPPFPPPLSSPHIHSLAITLYSCASRGLFIFDILNVAQYFSLQSTSLIVLFPVTAWV